MRRLLPDRKAPDSAFESTGEYTIEVLVPSDNPYIGQTLDEAGLYHIKGGSLIALYHFDNVPSPVTEDEPIMGGDHLVYAGQIDELIEIAKNHQLVAADHHVFTINEIDSNRQLRTAYVNFGSSLIGKTIGGSTFEKDNNLTLAAVARRGERINQAPRQVVLQAGDTQLLVCPKHFNVNTSSLSALHFFDSEPLPHRPDGKRKQLFRHAYRLAHPHAGLRSWRLSFQRLHAHRLADEPHHPRRQYLHREPCISFSSPLTQAGY